MPQPGKIRSRTSRNLPVGKTRSCPYRHFRLLQELAAISSRLDGAESGAGLCGHLVRAVAAIIEIPAAHSQEVALGSLRNFLVL